MRQSALDRVNRILLMASYVLSRGRVSVSDLCTEVGISREELLGDLELLSMCGVPDYSPYELIFVDCSEEEDYVEILMADYFKKPFRLTRDEALTLVVAGRALLKAGVFSPESAVSSALFKLERALEEDVRGEVCEIVERVDLEISHYGSKWRDVIEKGLMKGRVIKIDYYSYSREEVSEREVEPLSLIWANGYWYLQAFCLSAGEIRIFRLDRINRAEITRKNVKRELKGEMHVPEAVCEYQPGKNAYSVEMIFSDRSAKAFLERWPMARVREEGDRIVVKFKTRHLNWVANSIMKFGESVTVVKPEELRRIVEERAREILALYP